MKPLPTNFAVTLALADVLRSVGVPYAAGFVDVSSVPVDTLIPSRIPQRDDAPRRHRFTAEIAPAVVAVSICAFVILLSESFDSVVAISVGAVLMLGGVVALVRRVPLARAYTFGLVAAVVLIRFS